MLLALLILSIIQLFLWVVAALAIIERTRPVLEMHERLIHIESHVVELSEAISRLVMDMELGTPVDQPFRPLGGNTEGLKELFEHLAEDEEDDDDEDDEEGE